MALTDNLVAYWKLDESSGNASDSVGSATMTNNSVTYSTGKINNGAVFDSSAAKYLTTSAVSLFGNAFSISGWIKPSVTDSSNKEWFSFVPSSGAAYVVKAEGTATSKVRILLFNSAGSIAKDYITSSSGILTQNNWTHLVMTWDGTTLSLYANGTAQTFSKSSDAGVTLSNTSRLFALGIESGVSGGGNRFDGTQDEVGVWSRALSSSEVTQLYNGGLGFQYPFVNQNSNFLMLM